MTFENLPDELLVHILEYIPNAYKLNIVSKQFNDIVNDIKQRVFKNPNKYIEQLSPPVYFLLQNNRYHKLIWNKAILAGDLDLIIELKKLKYKFDADDEMLNAARGGHKHLIDFFIEKGADNWNEGMRGAAEGGHKMLVIFFIEKDADRLDVGMVHAAKGGHKYLVDFFIEKGGEDYPWNWDWAIEYAAEEGHKEVVEFFVEKGANLNRGLGKAAKGGHKDLVDFLIEKGANNWNMAMMYATEGGHKDLVKFFIEKGANV